MPDFVVFCCTPFDIHDPESWFGPACPTCGMYGYVEDPFCMLTPAEYAEVVTELRAERGTDSEWDDDPLMPVPMDPAEIEEWVPAEMSSWEWAMQYQQRPPEVDDAF